MTQGRVPICVTPFVSPTHSVCHHLAAPFCAAVCVQIFSGVSIAATFRAFHKYHRNTHLLLIRKDNHQYKKSWWSLCSTTLFSETSICLLESLAWALYVPGWTRPSLWNIFDQDVIWFCVFGYFPPGYSTLCSHLDIRMWGYFSHLDMRMWRGLVTITRSSPSASESSRRERHCRAWVERSG